MVDLPLQILDAVCSKAQLFAAQFAKHRQGTCRRLGVFQSPEFAQRIDLVSTLLAEQKVDHGALAFQQFFDQPFADESAGSGNEILHGNSS